MKSSGVSVAISLLPILFSVLDDDRETRDLRGVPGEWLTPIMLPPDAVRTECAAT